MSSLESGNIGGAVRAAPALTVSMGFNSYLFLRDYKKWDSLLGLAGNTKRQTRKVVTMVLERETAGVSSSFFNKLFRYSFYIDLVQLTDDCGGCTQMYRYSSAAGTGGAAGQ